MFFPKSARGWGASGARPLAACLAAVTECNGCNPRLKLLCNLRLKPTPPRCRHPCTHWDGIDTTVRNIRVCERSDRYKHCEEIRRWIWV